MKKVIVFAGPNDSGKSTVIAKQLKSGNLPELYICPGQLPTTISRRLVEYLSKVE